jgi:hypothetical protein
MPQSVRTNAKTGEQGALAGTGSSPSTAPLTGRANEWQVEWEQDTNGRWTKRLIPSRPTTEEESSTDEPILWPAQPTNHPTKAQIS